jgi:hypothetical protein
VDRKIILWSIVLFFGSSILFVAIKSATSGSSTAVSVGIQAAVLALIIVAIVLISRRRS